VKTNLYVLTDVEGRRPGSQIGLDTLVVQAENYECYMLVKHVDLGECLLPWTKYY